MILQNFWWQLGTPYKAQLVKKMQWSLGCSWVSTSSVACLLHQRLHRDVTPWDKSQYCLPTRQVEVQSISWILVQNSIHSPSFYFSIFLICTLRLSTSPGYPWFITGIPMGKPVGPSHLWSRVCTDLGACYGCCKYLPQVLVRLRNFNFNFYLTRIFHVVSNQWNL
jgi:hypothetical protein